MLRNDLVADLFTQYFNEAGKDFDKVFEIYDSATDYKIVKPLSIVGILSETGGSVKPVMNYVNTTCNYEIGLLYSVEAGFGEIKKINEIVENVIKALNGVPLQLSGGQALITFNQQHTGDYEINRPRIGKSVIPKLSFRVEHSQRQDGLRYEMALIDTQFALNCQDTRYFNSQEEQVTYYLNKVQESGVPFCETMTPNINSLTLQKQAYINDLRYYPEGTEKVKELNDILQKNYAIIRATDGDNAVAYYYYWVSNATVGDNNQALLDLKMDTLQTWYFNPNIEFADCLVHRAHLNRWIDNGDGTVSFDGTPTSKLFEREEIQNVAKRLKSRYNVPMYDTSTELGQWMNEHVLGWMYIYLDPNHNFTFGGSSPLNLGFTETKGNAGSLKINTKNGVMDLNLSVIVYPICEKGYDILIANLFDRYGAFNLPYAYAWGEYNPPWVDNSSNEDSLFVKFAEQNNYTYIYSIKLSMLPPFGSNLDLKQIEIWKSSEDQEVGNELVVVSPVDNTFKVYNPFLKDANGSYIRLWHVGDDINTDDRDTIVTQNVSFITIQETNYKLDKLKLNDVVLSFNKNEIIGANKSSNFNPKLYNSDYFSLNLSDSTFNGFQYDLQKLNTAEIQIIFDENLSPDVARKYLRIVPPSNSVYNNCSIENLTGFVSSNENSFIMATTAYQTMIANNKNYYLQNNINRGSEVISGVANSFVSFASGNILSGLTGLLGTGLNYAQNKISQNLTVDNLKNAPSNITPAKGNAIFECMYTQNGVIIEIWDILDNEKDIINDFMDMYGFTYNQIDNIKNCDNIRHYHNYIEADLTTISGISISNTIRDDIKQRFNQGVRFWNYDDIQYIMENYENWLED